MFDALILPRPLRTSPWPARLALAGAFFFCAWKAVGLAWLGLAGPDLPAAGPAAVLSANASPVARGQIAKWHLFGDTQGQVDLAALAQSKLQETALKLTLRGTFNETRPEGGIAIIADEQGTDRPYRVGDPLPGDARLEQILAGVVVLSRGGVSETLSLRLTETSGGDSAAPRGRTPTRVPLPGGGSALGSMSINPSIAAAMPDMQTYRATNLPNVQELAKQVQVMPAFVNGRMRGVRINAGRDSDLLEKAGLKPSDIVTAVNGIPLDNPARQSELLANLRDAKQVQIDVERDGKIIKLRLGM
ncbi:PDZ domain-containing protein [Xanthomonadaceae bacterium JHOS43]|nr:PDZ domain-containing protein [Xanthomonadaceae bacterium JHOS43]MCX7564431.1 PDZ domain-containing protein [Xanthomonadaceae bacterium XH05]